MLPMKKWFIREKCHKHRAPLFDEELLQIRPFSLQIFWFLYSSTVNWTCFGCGQDICDYLGYLENDTGCNKQSALEVLVGGFSSSRRIPVFPVNMLSYANRLCTDMRVAWRISSSLCKEVNKHFPQMSVKFIPSRAQQCLKHMICTVFCRFVKAQFVLLVCTIIQTESTYTADASRRCSFFLLLIRSRWKDLQSGESFITPRRWCSPVCEVSSGSRRQS